MKTRILATALCLLAIVAAVPCVAVDNSDAKVSVCTKGACLAEEDELGLIGGRHFIRILNRLVDDKAFGMAEMCFVKSDYRVLYVDEHIASYRLEEESYVGGAHGSTTVRVGTLVAGRRDDTPLGLSDIMKEEQRPQMTAQIREALCRHFGLKNDAELESRLVDEPRPTENFYYDKDGLHFVYNAYEIACHADGVIDICIQWPRPNVD